MKCLGKPVLCEKNLNMILIALLKCPDKPANDVSFGAGLFVWLANGRLDWVLKSLFLKIHLEPLMAEIQNTLHLYRRLMLSSVTREMEGFESPGKVLYKWPGKKLPPWFKLIRNGEITSLGPKHTLRKYVSANASSYASSISCTIEFWNVSEHSL